jgi:cytochrome c oxidase subunit IV
MRAEVVTGSRDGQHMNSSSHGPPDGGHGSRGSGRGGHASPAFYWTIGGILTVITAVEVAIFYIPALESVLVPSLLLLSAGKFLLVVMFFMHLKFDSRIFSGVFMAGMALAMFMTVALVVLYHVLPAHPMTG